MEQGINISITEKDNMNVSITSSPDIIISIDSGTISDFNNMINKPDSYIPSEHQHNIADINLLQTTLDDLTNSITADDNVATDLNQHIANVSNPHIVTKAQIGLSNVENTADVNKPISNAMQGALNLKANASSVESIELELDTKANALTTYSKTEVDDKISAIPTPDVSGQIDSHNSNINSHPYIKGLIESETLRAKTAESLKADKSTTYTKTNTDTLLSSKVDKVPGESLLSDSEITRLAGLSNVDISGKVDKTTTVNGRALSTNIAISATDVGLGSVDNTSDVNKPISTSTQTALNLKANQSTTYNKVEVNGLLDSKVAKDGVKQLSDENFSAQEKAKLSNLTQYTDAMAQSANTSALSNKVDKISGKGLSTNDLTNGLKTSYDNAVINAHSALTVGTENGLSLVGQSLSLGLASSALNGALSYVDWVKFNNKQNTLVAGTDYVAPTALTNYVPTARTVNSKALTANITLTSSDIAEGSNLYYTELRVNNNTNVSANTSARHTHSNSALLNSLLSNGDGSKYLANDGTYKTVTGGTAYTDDMAREALSVQMSNKADLVDGVIPASQLPSYVDDVLPYDNIELFPASGEDSKIYVAKDTNLTYRWNGSGYSALNPTLALGETSATAYAGDKGKTSYDHSQIISGNPHGTTKADLNLENVQNIDTTSTSNIADSTDKRFMTDAQKAVVGNTSGTNTGDETSATIKTKLGVTTLSGSNTGDQDLSVLVPKTTTVNTKALSANITLSTADIADSTDKRYVTDAQRTVLSNTSGANTGNVSIGTANGLSLTGQALSMNTASDSTTGALSSTDFNTFNNKQNALTAGTNISIVDNVISSSGGSGSTYTAGSGIEISAESVISTKVDGTTIISTDGIMSTGINYSAISTKTSDYILNASDNGSTIVFNSISTVVLNVEEMSVGFSCTVVQNGTGQVTISPNSTTMYNRNGFHSTAGQYAMLTILFTSSSTFIAQGDMAL